MRHGRRRITVPMAILLISFLSMPAWADDPANYLFAATQMRPEITIIDSSTDEVVGRITLPDTPDNIIALGRGRALAVAAKKSNKVYIIAVLDRRVERVMNVPLEPDELRIDSGDTTLAVLDHSTGKIALSSIEDGAFQTVPDISGATDIAFAAKGRIIVAQQTGATILDSSGRRVAELAADSAGGPVTHVAADPGGEYVFLAQSLRGFLSVFDAGTLKRLTALHLPPPLGRIVPDSQFVLLSVGEVSISVVSTWTLKERARFGVGIEPISIGLALFQSVATIVSQSAQQLILWDLRDQHRIEGIRLPGRPGLGAASSDGSQFYVTLPDTGQVASINLASRRIDRLIDNVGVGVWTVVPAIGNGYCH